MGGWGGGGGGGGFPSSIYTLSIFPSEIDTLITSYS